MSKKSFRAEAQPVPGPAYPSEAEARGRPVLLFVLGAAVAGAAAGFALWKAGPALISLLHDDPPAATAGEPPPAP